MSEPVITHIAIERDPVLALHDAAEAIEHALTYRHLFSGKNLQRLETASRLVGEVLQEPSNG